MTELLPSGREYVEMMNIVGERWKVRVTGD
jgi:hypothetical protein